MATTVQRLPHGLGERFIQNFVADESTTVAVDGTFTIQAPAEYIGKSSLFVLQEVITFGAGDEGARTVSYKRGNKSTIVTVGQNLAAGAGGADIAEVQIGSSPGTGRIVAVRYTPLSAITAGTTGATTDITITANKRTKAVPGTPVVVATGSNIDAEADALDGDGAAAALEAISLTLSAVAGALNVVANDVLTVAIVTGAGATSVACRIEFDIEIDASSVTVDSYVETTGVATLRNRTGATLATPRVLFQMVSETQ